MEVTQIFRPMNMKEWFMIDPVANQVCSKNTSVNGVKAEIAEAVSASDGLVIWRISGIPQRAEAAVDLEDGRQNNVQSVAVGALKVNPVKLQSAPKRIVTRTVVDVAPMSLVMLDNLPEVEEIIAAKKIIVEKEKKEHFEAMLEIKREKLEEEILKPSAYSEPVKPSSVGLPLEPVETAITPACVKLGGNEEEEDSDPAEHPKQGVVAPDEDDNFIEWDDELENCDTIPEQARIVETPPELVRPPRQRYPTPSPPASPSPESSSQEEEEDEEVFMKDSADSPPLEMGLEDPPLQKLVPLEPPLKIPIDDYQPKDDRAEDKGKIESAVAALLVPSSASTPSPPPPTPTPQTEPHQNQSSSDAGNVPTEEEEEEEEEEEKESAQENQIQQEPSTNEESKESEKIINRGLKRKSRDEIDQSDKRSRESNTASANIGRFRIIDSECHELQDKAHVYEETGDIYDIMLNQTNLALNSNKFYLLQLLKDIEVNEFYVWFRWGRVGKAGRSSLFNCGNNLELAKKQFVSKFYDKTKNDFYERRNFKKFKGKYEMVQISELAGNTDAIKKKMDKVVEDDASRHVKCTLPNDLRSFIELICNLKKMERALKHMHFDSTRSPLGQLTLQQIESGYAALKVIEDCISNGMDRNRLLEACNDFYTRIPHDFGMRVPTLIRDAKDIREKIDLLETLTDVMHAVDLLKQEGSSSIHPVDRQYLSLGIEFLPVHPKELAMITRYLKETHAPTHNQYKIRIKSVFAIVKEEENRRFCSDMGNRMLLWHGSRLSNWASIMSQGLRIAPPDAPSTGYMFGKGVYFADSSSKSANYCFPSATNNEGVLLLCEVALGRMNELFEADYNANILPRGKQSVKGIGRMAPIKSHHFRIKSRLDGEEVLVPSGPVELTKNPQRQSKCTLQYNEFVVYNVNQIRMSYAVRVKFDFNQ